MHFGQKTARDTDAVDSDEPDPAEELEEERVEPEADEDQDEVEDPEMSEGLDDEDEHSEAPPRLPDASADSHATPPDQAIRRR
jgi:hypothetical protein